MLHTQLSLSLESRSKVFLEPNQINKTGSNNRGILITAVFYFLAAGGRHED